MARRSRIDPDVARCIALAPPEAQPALEQLVRTLPLDDLLPVLRAARDGEDDDFGAVFLLGGLHARALGAHVRRTSVGHE
jgi:hypothetical protein